LSQLTKTIWQDIERTFPEYPFFEQPWVREMMKAILATYCRFA